ncbi:hypothetical protein B0I37DRAFT_334765 [Chaetomium sp. MPI-CAGE-AT-0009]|nr:hypothetical protein B0I37DRAFT_334765 [Chaetomium sp. MPI-CAGE-AT-0009]
MEGQPKHHLIRLSPYFRPVLAHGGYHGRRPTRHGFLSNLWGLQKYRISKPPSTFMNHPQKMPRVNPNSPSTPQRGLGVADGVSAHQIQSALDRNFDAFRREFQDVGRGIQRLEKTVDDISNELAQGIEKFFERFPPPQPVKQLEEMENALETKFQREHRIEVEGLKKRSELDRKRLNEMEMDLEMANMRAQIATTELARVQSMMDAEFEQIKKRQNAEKDITAAFLNLRKTILAFAGSTAVQLGPLPGAPAATDNLFHPWSWNHASSSQRNYRVMAKIFHLLFQRILRPGLRIFGVQVFLQSEEDPSISESEAHLRALEKELEAKGGQLPLPSPSKPLPTQQLPTGHSGTPSSSSSPPPLPHQPPPTTPDSPLNSPCSTPCAHTHLPPPTTSPPAPHHLHQQPQPQNPLVPAPRLRRPLARRARHPRGAARLGRDPPAEATPRHSRYPRPRRGQRAPRPRPLFPPLH